MDIKKVYPTPFILVLWICVKCKAELYRHQDHHSFQCHKCHANLKVR
jgi:hypothetical protein